MPVLICVLIASLSERLWHFHSPSYNLALSRIIYRSIPLLNRPVSSKVYSDCISASDRLGNGVAKFITQWYFSSRHTGESIGSWVNFWLISMIQCCSIRDQFVRLLNSPSTRVRSKSLGQKMSWQILTLVCGRLWALFIIKQQVNGKVDCQWPR